MQTNKEKLAVAVADIGEAMIDAGARALCRETTFIGNYDGATDLQKQAWRRQAQAVIKGALGHLADTVNK